MVVRLVVRMEVRMVVRLVVRMEPPAREGVGGLAQPLTQPFTNHGLKMHFKTFQAFFANIANTPLSYCQGGGVTQPFTNPYQPLPTHINPKL